VRTCGAKCWPLLSRSYADEVAGDCILSPAELVTHFFVVYRIADTLCVQSPSGTAEERVPSSLMARATTLNALEDCGTKVGLDLSQFKNWFAN